MCICCTAYKYTFILECDIFQVAKWVVNRIKVASEAILGVTIVVLQKDVNLRWPAEYAVLVVVVKPLL